MKESSRQRAQREKKKDNNNTHLVERKKVGRGLFVFGIHLPKGSSSLLCV